MLSAAAGGDAAERLRSALQPGARDDDALFHALAIATELVASGELDLSLELIDASRVRFPEHRRFLPQMLCLRADVCRDRYRFEEALADLDAARAALQSVLDPITGFYVEAVSMQVFLDLGLLAPAREAAAKMEALLAQALALPEVTARPETVRGLKLESARRRFMLEHDGLNHGAAVAIVDELLRDASVLPPPAPGGSGMREDERELLVRRGVAACYQARAEGPLGADVGALLDGARRDLERALGEDVSATLAGGELGFEEARKALLALADVAWQARDLAAEERALDRLDALLEGSATPLNAEDEARRTAFRARRPVAQAAALDAELGAARGGAREASSSAGAARDALEAERRLADLRAELRADRERLAAVQADLEQAWLRVPRTPEGLGFLHGDVHVHVLATWLQVVLAADPEQGPREALKVLARAQAVATIAQARGGGRALLEQAPARVDAYLAALPEGSGVLAFLPSLETSFVFAADADGVVCREIEPRPVLREAVAALARDVESPPPEGASQRKSRALRIRTNAERLAATLLPVAIAERVAAWKRVELVGAELLGRPVLEQIPLGGTPLGASHATAYLPGLALADVLAGEWRAGGEGASCLVLAGPERDDALALDLAPGFVERLRALVGQGELRLGAEAHLGGRGDAVLARADVLALLAHGAYDAELRRPAMVALAPREGGDDGMLTCTDVEALGPGLPRLVLFLACDSALGPTAPGDAGVADLGGAALLGGAHAALVSSNDVSRRAAEIVLLTMLARLRAGDPPDEALRRARLAVAAEPGLDDPFYTISLRLFGLGHLPLVGARGDSEQR